jgi:hypothetical protein
MASGSQTKSGICADLPVAPPKRSRQTTVRSGHRAEHRVLERRRLRLQPGDVERAGVLEQQEEPDQNRRVRRSGLR